MSLINTGVMFKTPPYDQPDTAIPMRKKTSQIHVVHIITSLAADGTGSMLYQLLTHTNRRQFFPVVISLETETPLARKIRSHGIPVHCLNMVNSLSSGWHILRLVRLLRELTPDIIQGWMYHGNLAASIANLALSNHYPVLWNIRQSLYGLEHENIPKQWAIRLSAKRSSKPERILYNSYLSAEQHTNFGFDESKTHIIANGIDTGNFVPNPFAGHTIRESLSIPPDDFVIGMVAHYHPMKNYTLFLEAANFLGKHQQRVHFVLAGQQVDRSNREFNTFLARHPHLQGRLHLLGQREDIPAILNALDVFTLTSSHGEGFPNTIGEAMACGIPCIATDIGDTPRIIGNTGQTLTAATPSQLAFAWLEWIRAGKTWRQEQGQRAAQRIRRHYDIRDITTQYQELYKEILQERQYSEETQPFMKNDSSNISMNLLA